MNITHLQNTKSVEEFATYIQHRLQSNTRNWWEVATAFSEARDMYGTGSKQFKELSKITRFSESTIAKMISIINSDRLRQYAVSFSSVHSWGTLYAISSLTDEQFEALKVKYKLDEPQTLAPFITQADVSRFKKEPSISLALILEVAFVDLTTYFLACGSLILANQNGEAWVLYMATPLWTLMISPSKACLVGVFGAGAAVSTPEIWSLAFIWTRSLLQIL